jgi:hypothetical protein
MGANGFSPSPMSVTLMRNKIKKGTAKNNSSQNQGKASTRLRPRRKKRRLKKAVAVDIVKPKQLGLNEKAGG